MMMNLNLLKDYLGVNLNLVVRMVSLAELNLHHYHLHLLILRQKNWNNRYPFQLPFFFPILPSILTKQNVSSNDYLVTHQVEHLIAL